MAKRTPTHADYDSPWKDALQLYLPAFLLYFFPDIHADIDWSRGYHSLDKEFQKISRRAKVGKRIADKLFKVWLTDGAEHWLLIHVEVQGDYEKEFPQRMFDYNSAVRQLYNKDVVSLAVLCDDRPDWRPTTFAHGRWGCKMELTFRNVKLLDFADKVEALEASDNPFAAIVLAHCKTLETRRNPESRRAWKMRVVRGLFERGWSNEEVRQLFRLIDWIMALPDDLERDFLNDLDDYVGENKMEYMSSIERRGYQKGIEEGVDKGVRKGLLEAIGDTLEARFAMRGRKLFRRVKEMENVGELRAFLKHLNAAKSITEIDAYLSSTET